MAKYIQFSQKSNTENAPSVKPHAVQRKKESIKV